MLEAQSFRLKNLRGEDAVFQPGKVSSIRQKFVRKSPDGASDTDTIAWNEEREISSQTECQR